MLPRLKQRMAAKKAEKAEVEKRETIEKEKMRRNQGKGEVAARATLAQATEMCQTGLIDQETRDQARGTPFTHWALQRP